jgi:arylsulfatase A-like enzyme
MKTFNLFVIATVLLLSCQNSFSGGSSSGKPRGKANIIFFLIDDQRNDTLGCYGHPVVKTPVIDSLAANGVRFENAFVTTSICAASRATFFTGLYERGHHYNFGRGKKVSEEHFNNSYPALLKKKGYVTGHIGKYGINAPANSNNRYFDFLKNNGTASYKALQAGKKHETERQTDDAIKFLKELPKGKNFCLQVSFYASHARDGDLKNHYPSPVAVKGKYDDLTMAEPRLNDPKIYEAHPDFLKKSLNRQRFFWRWDTKEKYQKNIKGYFRMLSGIDGAIGRVLKELKKLKKDKNTVIIVMSDNGYYMGERGFAGKWSHYEESLRVPLIIHDPRSKHKGKVKKQMVLNVDIAPTICDLAGIDSSKKHSGVSLSPIIYGQDKKLKWRTDFLFEHLWARPIPLMEGVRDERYVYARYTLADKSIYEYLHDLKQDPDQLKNLAQSSKHKKTIAKLRKRCDALIKQHSR